MFDPVTPKLGNFAKDWREFNREICATLGAGT